MFQLGILSTYSVGVAAYFCALRLSHQQITNYKPQRIKTMDSHFQIVLTIFAVLSLITGFRAEKDGWILVVGVPAMVLSFFLAMALVIIGLLWCVETPIDAKFINVVYFLSAICVPFWLGRNAARLR